MHGLHGQRGDGELAETETIESQTTTYYVSRDAVVSQVGNEDSIVGVHQ